MLFNNKNQSSLVWALIAAALLACLTGNAHATNDEWVIEMHGTPSAATPVKEISIWDKNTQQLMRALRGKTREEVLYAVPHVSSKDRIVRTEEASYAVVEYQDKDKFRKFVFRGKDPQTFITAAATVQDVLAVNKKYHLTIPITQAAFEQAYTNQYTTEPSSALPLGTVLYSVSYTDTNTPKAQTQWFLFENKQLTQIFYTAQDKDKYLESLQPQPAQEQPAPKPTAAAKTPPRKVLVSGGTVWDQMYMPKLVEPNKTTN